MRKLWIILGALVLLGVVARRVRPARLRDAGLISVTPGTPPVARLALEYGPGARPVSVIVDIEGANGRGSATVNGTERLVEVPLVGAAGGEYRIVVTPSYRILGRAYTTADVFRA